MTRQSPPIVPERGVPLTAETVVVPVEPTREMWAAGGTAACQAANQPHDKVVEGVWSAMLSAAPAREPEGGAVLAAEDVPVWSDGIVTDGERVALAQKAEADHGGTYWAVDGGDGGLDWEPTHFIALAALTPREAPASEGGA